MRPSSEAQHKYAQQPATEGKDIRSYGPSALFKTDRGCLPVQLPQFRHVHNQGKCTPVTNARNALENGKAFCQRRVVFDPGAVRLNARAFAGSSSSAGSRWGSTTLNDLYSHNVQLFKIIHDLRWNRTHA